MATICQPKPEKMSQQWYRTPQRQKGKAGFGLRKRLPSLDFLAEMALIYLPEDLSPKSHRSGVADQAVTWRE